MSWEHVPPIHSDSSSSNSGSACSTGGPQSSTWWGRAIETIKKADRRQWTLRAFGILALISFILSVVVLGVALAGYVNPLYSFIPFGLFIGFVTAAFTIPICWKRPGDDAPKSPVK